MIDQLQSSSVVLIQSTTDDISTNYVIDWLDKYNQKWLRLSENNINEYLINGPSEKEIQSIWYRREPRINKKEYTFNNQIVNGESLNLFFQRELDHLKNYYEYKSNARILGKSGVRNMNRLIVLEQAKHLGISIPKFEIVNSKRSLKKFIAKFGPGIICKSISNTPSIIVKSNEDRNKIFTNYTEIIASEDFKDIPEKYFPTLVMEKVDKEYELRVFYLDGKFYSMAIFSQNNSKTNLDFRRYDYENPNRTVPYILPLDLEEKLRSLFRLNSLNTGSIDIIRSVNKEYVFLEINPCGQYGMVSYPCNYNLDRKIAKYLIDNNNEQDIL